MGKSGETQMPVDQKEWGWTGWSLPTLILLNDHIYLKPAGPQGSSMPNPKQGLGFSLISENGH